MLLLTHYITYTTQEISTALFVKTLSIIMSPLLGMQSTLQPTATAGLCGSSLQIPLICQAKEKRQEKLPRILNQGHPLEWGASEGSCS